MSFWRKITQLFREAGDTHSPVDQSQLEPILGYRFDDEELLRLSLTHRSAIRGHSGQTPSNERLEFLGDSVLGLIVADLLYNDNPDLDEGDLTKQKAMLVNETALSTVAQEVGLNKFVRLSPEEEASGGRERASIISDAFEAVIGASYLDGGIKAARSIVTRLIYARRVALLNDSSQQNYKGELLELIQANGGNAPQYEVVSESGPDHDKLFTVVVHVDNKRLGEGNGPSKKEAEQRAAAQALSSLRSS